MDNTTLFPMDNATPRANLTTQDYLRLFYATLLVCVTSFVISAMVKIAGEVVELPILNMRAVFAVPCKLTPSKMVDAALTAVEVPADDVCGICRDDFELPMQLRCGHVFCSIVLGWP